MSPITRVYRSTLPTSAQEVFSWHENPAAFARLTPPWMQVSVQEASGGIEPGDWKLLRIPVAGPFGFSWRLTHAASVRNVGFVDIQDQGPFTSWKHEHRFQPDGNGNTVLEDLITYELPYGSVGEAVAGRKVSSTLDQLFRFRHERTATDIESLSRQENEHMRIAVTGASGLVGKRLVSYLQSGGHEVLRLVRHTPRTHGDVFWNPATGEIDGASLEGLDAVVHLAGVSIAGGRWTRSRKAAILNSRVDGTRLLSETLADLTNPPEVLVSTSAVGYYGDSGNRVLTEESPAGEGFLADVCRAWESATAPASAAGIRVVNPRFGLVFSGDGGMLPLISLAFKMGVGGPLGNGKQYMSWIALDDLVNIIVESIENVGLRGPVNAVSPKPVTSREFAKTLGKVLRRPSFMPVPGPAMRLVAGQLADELILASQRVAPTVLQDAGFTFRFADLEDALRFELGRQDHLRSGIASGSEIRERKQRAA